MRSADNEIKTKEYPTCCICGSDGVRLYTGLKDVIFEAPGAWDYKKCPDEQCGLVWLDPMPLQEEIGKAYTSYYTHEGYRKGVDKNDAAGLRKLYEMVKSSYLSSRYGYGQSGSYLVQALALLICLVPSRRAYLDFMVFFLKANQGGRLIEVGCGNGETLGVLSKLGWDAEGVDFDPAAVSFARSKGLNVSLGSLEQQMFADNRFDALVMSHLIEHVDDPVRLIRESHRVLKPGGRLVIVTPNSKSFGHSRFREHWRGIEPPRHLHIFNDASLRALVTHAGFADMEVFSSIRNADNIFLASEMNREDNMVAEGRPETVRRRIWAACMQYFEWLLMKVNPDIGEEVSLIAVK